MVRHRRNNAVAGIFLVVAALLVAASAMLPWVHVHGPEISVELVSLDPGFDLTPGGPIDEDGVLRSTIVGFAVVLGVLALALIATRVRGLGVLWRLLALVVVAGPLAATWFVWTRIVADPSAWLEESELAGVLIGLATSTGLMTVDAGLGLWCLSIGAGLGLVAIVIPAARSTTLISSPGTYPPQPEPPGPAVPNHREPYPPSYPPGSHLGW